MMSLMSKNLSSKADGVTITSKVHSEVQLVAWVAQNLNRVAPEVTLVPYVTCSKLHCFACFIWLQEFNHLNHTTLPCLAFDGGHGGLQRGWLPPSLETADLLERMTSRLETEFLDKHAKHSSASTTFPGRVKVNVAVTPKVESRLRKSTPEAGRLDSTRLSVKESLQVDSSRLESAKSEFYEHFCRRFNACCTSLWATYVAPLKPS
ncbi:hypothetical protein C8F04DRAFT_645242 [Mycena alexandri]|uniref:Uncharacterized protein n=1 Tax=Mycena alexandri TaxID=1745969 RepID=A0AAD6X2S9_9AGAR|nr:hypothetical protein C8F04DRAFT_645242 [Mycena alexandri]